MRIGRVNSHYDVNRLFNYPDNTMTYEPIFNAFVYSALATGILIAKNQLTRRILCGILAIYALTQVMLRMMGIK